MCATIKYSLAIFTFLYISIDGNQFELYSYDDIFTTPVVTNERHSRISGFFDLRFSHNITTIAGQTAFLNCRVRNIGRKTVSWVRHVDINLLTVGKYTYSSDERFVPLHNDETGDWTLQVGSEAVENAYTHIQRQIHFKFKCNVFACSIGIPDRGALPDYLTKTTLLAMIIKHPGSGTLNTAHYHERNNEVPEIKYATPKDSGAYECQVSTTPPIGLVIYLSVVEPKTTIIGGPDIYINTGSTVNLTCIILQSPYPPQQIQWTHNNKKINYDSPRGGVSVITEKGETTTSYLLVQRAKPGDSGKYCCIPSNANTFSVNVHILNGENPAAMQHTSDRGSVGMLPQITTVLPMFLTIYLIQMYKRSCILLLF